MKEVGIRIRVGAAGLENVDALTRKLKDAGVETAEFEKDAQDLGRELQKLGREQALIDQFGKIKREGGEAAKALKDAQASTRTLALEMRGLEAPTKAQTTAFEKSKGAVRDAAKALQDNKLALQNTRAALAETGIATDQLAAAQVRVRTQTEATTQRAQNLRAELQRQADTYTKTGATAVAAGAQQAAAARSVGGAVEQLQGQLGQLRNLVGVALGGSVVGSLASDLAKTADQYANLAARVKLATGEGQAFEFAFEEVQKIALRTSSALEGTATLFARISQAGKDLGLSQQQSLALTETINQAVQLSGASADSSNAAITQLIQGLQSGVLRGEEFNSVMEQSPRLAQALAAGLGVGIGALRQMAQEGKLTSETVIDALRGQSEVVGAEFAKLPPTVGRALTNLSTQWTVYVGEVDKANGISTAAASAIGLLANNLDTLGTLLFAAGKAAAAYQALKLAQTFLGIGTAARTATAEIVTMTAAQGAATAATAGQAAAVGRLAGLLSTIKLFSLVGVVTNLESIGTAIGEQVAKWAGWGNVLEESERNLRADEAASRANAEGKAKLAQELKAAADRSLELSEGSRTLVTDFDALIKGGSNAADAIQKIGKDLDLGDVRGVRDAITALDALARQGKITGQQVKKALSDALSGKDLGIFEAQAKAAFDGSTQGARRLQEAMDAIADESLKRAGTSVDELKTGFSTAMNSAINNTDALARTLVDLQVPTAEASRLLASSLDKELEAATTETAIKAVIARYVEMGEKGFLAGEAVSAGLNVAKNKLDDLKAGINSVDEALRNFGLKTRAELTQTADKLSKSWQQIRNDTTIGLAEKITAFGKYRDSAIAANNGVESSEVQLDRMALQAQASVRNLGTQFETSMKTAALAVDNTTRSQLRTNDAVVAGTKALQAQGVVRRTVYGTPIGETGGIVPFGDSPSAPIPFGGGTANNTPGVDRVTATASAQVPKPSGGPWEFTLDPQQIETSSGYSPLGVKYPGGWKRPAGYVPPAAVRNSGGGFNPFIGQSNEGTPRATPSSAAAGRTVTVNLNVGGQSIPVTTNDANADALLRALEDAQKRAGG